MTEPDDQPASALPWLWAISLLLVVGGAGIGGYLWLEHRKATGQPAFGNGPPVAPEPSTVQLGRDYYVHVKLVELRPTRENGTAWDRADGSAPDPFVRVRWQDAEVFESAARGDAFVAAWDLISVDLKEVALSSGGEVDIESMVNAPVVRVEKDTTVEVEVIDDDLIDNTEAGTVTLELAKFHEGDNVLTFTPEEQPLIARMVVGVLDRKISLPDLIDAVSKR